MLEFAREGVFVELVGVMVVELSEAVAAGVFRTAPLLGIGASLIYKKKKTELFIQLYIMQ